MDIVSDFFWYIFAPILLGCAPKYVVLDHRVMNVQFQLVRTFFKHTNNVWEWQLLYILTRNYQVFNYSYFEDIYIYMNMSLWFKFDSMANEFKYHLLATHTCVHTYTHVCIYVGTYKYICVYAFIYACVCTYMHIKYRYINICMDLLCIIRQSSWPRIMFYVSIRTYTIGKREYTYLWESYDGIELRKSNSCF